MKVKLKKDILKKYGFAVGGDMSESVAVAVDSEGNPVNYKDINNHKGVIHTQVFHCTDEGTEFLVVGHNHPMSKQNYDRYSSLYEEITETSKLDVFLKNLNKLKKPKSRDPYESGRTNHCDLEHEHKGVKHVFEVRGWGKIENGELMVHVVNWTLCAGTATLTLNEERVDSYRILEEYPSKEKNEEL